MTIKFPSKVRFLYSYELILQEGTNSRLLFSDEVLSKIISQIKDIHLDLQNDSGLRTLPM